MAGDNSVSDESLKEALERLVPVLESIKASSEVDKGLVDELKRTVSDHDKALVLMAKAIEDMNKNSAEMTEVFKSFQVQTLDYQKQNQDTMFKHWKTQDKLMVQFESVLKTLSKLEPEVSTLDTKVVELELKFKESQTVREIHIKHWEDVKASLLEAVTTNAKNIGALNERTEVCIEKAKVSQNRHTGSEEAIKTLSKSFEDWKESVYKALIGYGIAIIGSLVAAIWGIIK